MDPSAETPNSDAQALTKAPAHVLLPPPPRRDIRHRGPGLTLLQLSKDIGDFIEPPLNLLFRPFGPESWRRCIENLFGDDAHRETVLDELHGNPHCSSGRLRPLERHCHGLLKLARPKDTTVETQLITFKNVVALITRYPGIRRPLHAHKDVKKALATDPSLSSLWNRPHLACGDEWTFYRNFAAFCISNNAFAITELLEAERPSKLGRVELSGNLDRVPIETLLGQSRDGPEFHLSRLCAIRYLAGILELPSFWRQFPSNTGAGRERQRFIAVLSDLCGTLLQLIRDTEGTAPDIIVVFPSSMVAGRMAVDVLSCSLLNGLLQMKHLNTLPRRVPAPLPMIISILLRDDGKTFPRAVNPATQVAAMLESSPSSFNEDQDISDGANTKTKYASGSTDGTPSPPPLVSSRVEDTENADVKLIASKSSKKTASPDAKLSAPTPFDVRAICPQFRILVIGKANGGKTTLLKKVCDSIDDPEIFSPSGEKIDPTVLETHWRRGEHDINNQLVFKSNPGYIFHDSRGFVSGSEDEIKRAKTFIAERVKTTELSEQLHAIWYCLPTDTNRPVTKADEDFFYTGVRGQVPLIAIFTKVDGLEDSAFTQLQNAGYNIDEAMEKLAQKTQEMLTTDFRQRLEQTDYPPSEYVQLYDMRNAETSCKELIEKTAATINDVFVSVQRNNIGLSVGYAEEGESPSL